jgi:lactonase
MGLSSDAADGYTKVNTFYEGMASPNGISLTPEENGIWVAEPGRSALVRFNMTPGGNLAPIGAVAYVYYGTGDQGMDSNKVDAKGNLYQPMMGGGRVLVFDPHGIPIANVLIPGRDQGKSLMSPNLALKPGTDEAYLQGAGPDGTWLYTFKAIASAHKLYSHQ